MMQKTIGTYLAKRIKDEIFASPQEQAEEERETGNQPVQHGDPLDGELIRDDQGRVLGRAYRVPAVNVYVVSGSNANPDAELERALNDPNAQTIIHWQGDQIAALVFVPEQAINASAGMHGFRADDV